MAGLGIFPESGMAVIYTASVILIIGFVWLLFEKPKVALTILEGLARAAFAVVKALVMVVWYIATWIGRQIGKLFR